MQVARGPRKVAPAGRRRGARWSWRWIATAAAVLILAVGFVVMRETAGPASEGLAAEHTTHDFGQTPIGGGPVVARFPLTIEEPTVVTDLGTT